VATEPAGALVFIGNAQIVPGTRPDVAVTYPGYPGNTGGWGYLLLTNELPNSTGQPGVGNGTYNLHVLITDNAGQVVDLGARTITVNNAASILPFGSIDTPTQGGTASGTAFVNFGWVLTPEPNMIPFNGSTIKVLIDTPCPSSAVVPTCNPMTATVTGYNISRCDVDQDFPSLANSGSTNCALSGGSPGPVGYYYLDTTKLANGLHTIAWVVTDSAGNASGIGSRYFNVQN
jgi:hypothetical protein